MAAISRGERSRLTASRTRETRAPARYGIGRRPGALRRSRATMTGGGLMRRGIGVSRSASRSLCGEVARCSRRCAGSRYRCLGVVGRRMAPRDPCAWMSEGSSTRNRCLACVFRFRLFRIRKPLKSALPATLTSLGSATGPCRCVVLLSFGRKPRACGLFLVRPARAHSCGCKSRHELITASEAKRNCTRVTECGEEARSAAASR